MYKLKKKIIYFIEGISLLSIFILLKILPLNISSFLMGKLSSLIGPRLSVSKKAYNNIKNVMPEKSENEIKHKTKKYTRTKDKNTIIFFSKSRKKTENQ